MISIQDYPQIETIVSGLPFGETPTEEANELISEIVSSYKLGDAVEPLLAKLRVLIDAQSLQVQKQQEQQVQERQQRENNLLVINTGVLNLVEDDMQSILNRCNEDMRNSPFFESWSKAQLELIRSRYAIV